MTVRIDPKLLAALRRRATRSGRSVSAEVIDLIRREVQPVRAAATSKTLGMFPAFEAPSLDVFKDLRRQASAGLKRRFGRP